MDKARLAATVVHTDSVHVARLALITAVHTDDLVDLEIITNRESLTDPVRTSVPRRQSAVDHSGDGKDTWRWPDDVHG